MSATIYLNDGATETDIINALKAMPDGGTLVLPKNATIQIVQGLYVDVSNRDVTLDLNGSTLVEASNKQVVLAKGGESSLEGVTLGVDANGNTTITYVTLPTGLSAGDWVKVVADDAIPGDHIDTTDNGNPTRLGQAEQILAINGNTVTLKGELLHQDLYQTNVRAAEILSGSFVMKNGSIAGNTSQSTWTQDLVQVRNTIGAAIQNVTVRDSNGCGINVVNSIDAHITDGIAKNLGAAAIHSAASVDTTVVGLFAENVMHGISDNCVGNAPNSNNTSQYGADIGLTGTDSVIYGATRSGLDWHSEGWNGYYSNDLVFNSNMFADFRGFNNTIVNSAGDGNAYGIQFYEYGSDDARYNLVDNVVLRETKNYTFIISATPADNIVQNSHFESYGQGYGFSSSVVQLINDTILQNVKGDNDTLLGTISSDNLLGGKGADIIYGDGGNDYIWGGDGVDILTGGAGRDRFAYHALSEGGDVITDFQTGAGGDLIDVSVLAARLGWQRTDLIASHMIQAVQSGTDAIVQAADGSGGWVTLATLANVNAATFTSANIQYLLSGADVAPAPAAPPDTNTADPSPVNLLPVPVPVSAPAITSVAYGSNDGTLKAGEFVTFSISFTDAVTVAGGTPFLALDDGATASYVSGSGSNVLTFKYTVGAGQSTSDLSVTGMNLNGATLRSDAGIDAVIGNVVSNPDGVLLVDTTTPSVMGVSYGANSGTLKAGDSVTLSVKLSEAVQVAGGNPTLSLNSGGAAVYSGGAGTDTLLFTYTAKTGEATNDLAVTGLSLNGAVIADAAGNIANLSGATANPAGILAVTPLIQATSATYGTNDGTLKAGESVTLVITFAAPVSYSGTIRPALALNDGGTATYVSGAGTSTWTFKYTVLPGENVPDLAIAGIAANGATLKDTSGRTISIGGSSINPTGILVVDTAAPIAPHIDLLATDSSVIGDHITNVAVSTLSGTAEANSTVTFYNGAYRLGSVLTDATGHWTFKTPTLGDGTYQLVAKSTDVAGNVSAGSDVFSLTIDTKMARPTIAAMSIDTGAAGDHVTFDNDLLLSGNGEANSQITLYDGAKVLGQTTVSASGTWSLQTGTLADGAHSFTVKDVDTAGNSNTSTVFQSIVDTVNPSPTFVKEVATLDGNKQTLSGTSDVNSSVSIYDNGTLAGTVKASSIGNWSFTTNYLSDTVHAFTVVSTDVAGNTGSGKGIAYYGSSGNDTLLSTAANDVFVGNAGADTFVFNQAAFGNDLIRDFQATGTTHDVLQFDHNVFSSVQDIMAHAAQVGSNVVITHDALDIVTLQNVKLASLTASDFHIV